ncbi:hypothetical protein SRT_01810 [Streptococcus troglodytae]|uniref:Uncharacterized protein n=1 Tax=Streptococcus troglodytae TaxID=1111760 RepID=A0A1L7LHG1_9STRE|nr:hypothetical protein SRT_01810 [Streptococcus troglodytae]
MKSQEAHQCIFEGSSGLLRKRFKTARFWGREVYKGIKIEKKEKLLTKGRRADRIKKLSQKEAEPFEN